MSKSAHIKWYRSKANREVYDIDQSRPTWLAALRWVLVQRGFSGSGMMRIRTGIDIDKIREEIKKVEAGK